MKRWYFVIKNMTRASFCITMHMTYQKPFWIWIWICQNIPFFVTLSILHIQTCMIPLMKAVLKGFISFSYSKELEQFMGTLWPQKLKKTDVFVCNIAISSHRITCNTSIESFYKGLHFFFLHWRAMINIWGHYDLKAWKFDDLTVLCAVWFTYLF